MNTQVGSELDIAIIDALQMNPRADWVQVAGALGHTPKTLARRWRTLSDSGLAWIALVPGPGFVRYGAAAFAAVTCRPQATRAVVAALVAEPAIVSVASTSGDASLLLDVFAPSFEQLTRLLRERIDVIEGITSVRVMVVLATYREGSRWRVRALDLHQSALLTRPRPTASRRQSPAVERLDQKLLDALEHDGRSPWTDLAERCATTSPTARRRIDKMINSGRVALRCEAANALIGPIVPTTFMITAPPDELNKIGETLGRIPRCRVIEAITGPSNILLTMWFRSTGDIAPFEAALARELPGLAIMDRLVHLRAYKRGGRILDTDGRAVDLVPSAAIMAAANDFTDPMVR
jgi:DNA-binding Lrp family transcriptional regulator